MAMFSYLYFNSYVAREVGNTVGSVLSAAMQVPDLSALLPVLYLHLPLKIRNCTPSQQGVLKVRPSPAVPVA